MVYYSYMDYSFLVNQLKQLSPKAIILFGSRANGTAHEDSDVDILLIKETNETFNKRITEAHRVLRTNLPIDIVVLTPTEVENYKKNSSFYQSVFTSGKVLYGRI